MNKILKYSLLGVAAVVTIAVAGAAYIVLTFNPNDYKAQIVKVVKESTQRNLRLDGEIKLSFFPNIGASLGKMSLSEFQSEKEFAAIESVRVSLALLPLLRQQVIVDEVVVSGLNASLVKHKDGTTNIDDLLGKDGQTQEEDTPNDISGSPIKFDVESVMVEKVNLGYLDYDSGGEYAINDLTLNTGRIANGVPGNIDLSFRLQINQPKLDLATHIKTLLTFDLDKNKYQLQDLLVQTNGMALDLNDFNMVIKGNARADMASQEFAADNIELNTILGATFGNIVANLSLQGIELKEQTLKVGTLNLDVDLKQAEQVFKVKSSSSASGNIKSQQFNLRDLRVVVNATGEKLPNKSVSSEMKGNIQLDALNQNVQVNLAGGLLQSQIKADIEVKSFAAPAIKFDIQLDQLDADLYLPKQSAEAPKSQVTASEQPFDLAALKSLNLDGSLQIGTLKAMNIKTEKLRVEVKANNGLLKVDPFSANLYQGSITSSITLNAAKSLPEFAVSSRLNGIEIGPLLNDALKMDFLNGKGTVDLNVTTQGNLVSLLKKNLNGTLSLNLADGAVKGINLAKSVREFGKGGDKTQAANKEEKTDFSELKASFNITNGIAHNEDLSLKSPFVRVGGKGDINLGNDSLDYLVKATIARTSEGQGGKDDVGGITVPVRMSGPYSDIKYKLEFSSMVSGAAKQKVSAAADAAKQKAIEAADAAKQKAQQAVDAQKEQAKTKAQEQLKNKLKGLFN